MTFQRRDDFSKTRAGINSLKWFVLNGQSVKLEVSSNYFAVTTLQARGFIGSLRHLRILVSPRLSTQPGSLHRHSNTSQMHSIIVTLSLKEEIRSIFPHISETEPVLYLFLSTSLHCFHKIAQNFQHFRCFWGIKRQTFWQRNERFFQMSNMQHLSFL